jgi:hypothetical protein
MDGLNFAVIGSSENRITSNSNGKFFRGFLNNGKNRFLNFFPDMLQRSKSWYLITVKRMKRLNEKGGLP